MRNPIAIPSTLLSLLITSHASPTPPHQSPLGPSPSPSPYPFPATAIPYTFRSATLDDIDDITTTWYEAFRPGPLWNYIYQFTDDVDPLYRWTCQRETVRRMFRDAASQDVRTNVITVQVPDASTSTPSSRQGDVAATTREKVVSFAMWDFNQTGGRLDGEDDSSPSMSSPMLLPMGLYSSDDGDTSPGSSSPCNCSAHLDVNMTRALQYTEIMEAAYVKYLREAVGPQLYLDLLATHPGWDGNGFGAAQLRWGKARLGHGVGGGGGSGSGSESLPLTLIATPAGYPLYVSEGFEGLKNVTVERLDGAGVIWHEIMQFEEGAGGVDEL